MSCQLLCNSLPFIQCIMIRDCTGRVIGVGSLYHACSVAIDWSDDVMIREPVCLTAAYPSLASTTLSGIPSSTSSGRPPSTHKRASHSPIPHRIARDPSRLMARLGVGLHRVSYPEPVHQSCGAQRNYKGQEKSTPSSRRQYSWERPAMLSLHTCYIL